MKRTMLSVVTALMLSVALLAGAIYGPATAAWVMRPLMERFAPPEATRLPAEEYAPVADMITGYLRGETDAFQHVFTVEGIEYAAFNQKEQQHMADVQGLFMLCLRIGALLCGAACIAGILLWKRLQWRAFRRTIVITLTVAAAVVALACIDFDSLFVLFHRIAFTNDLWLLDPRTDLLIRLMPIGFFISYAAVIGGLWLLGMAGLLAASTIIINKPYKPKGE